jgi:putative membrane protein
MLKATWKKNDRRAKVVILSFSVLVFAAVIALGRVKLNIDPGFDVRIFAKLNAAINSAVSVLLLAGLLAVKNKQYLLHKRIMLSAMVLSVLFLLSYMGHHLLAGETKYGGTGTIRYIYYFILGTHIVLAGIVLPFILFSAYRALTGEFDKHRKLVRFTWPVWFYVAVTGVAVYFMISPYYT